MSISEEPARASLFLRVLAKSVDLLMMMAAFELVPRAGLFAGLIYLLLSDGFFEGQSIGKRLLKLRVVHKDTGDQCTFRSAAIRNSPLAVGWFFLLLPWIGWVFFVFIVVFESLLLLGSKEGTRLGDEISNTRVIEA